MRRAIARGRVFPQSYSTDRRYGRLSLKACALLPLMWANADDQGRLCGDPEEIKYACCPNIDHLTKADIPGILEDLETNLLIKVYESAKSTAVQILDWWDVQRPQWAWPSQYPPREGWRDRLRYKKGASIVITENWPVSGERSGDRQTVSQVSGESASGERSGETSGKPSFPHTPYYPEEERRKRKEEIRNSPERSGEINTTPQGDKILRSRMEAEETLCEGGRDEVAPKGAGDSHRAEGDGAIISVWRSVKGFDMTPADALALVARLRTEFPDLDILAESKTWAARKLSEPLKRGSKPSQQIWNWMRLARKFAQERRLDEHGKGARVKGSRPPADFRGREW